MGFGLNVITLSILLTIAIILIFFYFRTRKKVILKLLAGLGLLVAAGFVLITSIRNQKNPIRLARKDIIGEYKIDTNFYPGPNARWQFEKFSFTITHTDSIHFYLYSNETKKRSSSYRIDYSSGPPDLWRVQSDTMIHLIGQQPTLYRGPTKFYYVFHSKRYGNMFFRKME